MRQSGKIEMLLLEDNPADADFFRQSVARQCNVTVAQTGAEALDLLFRRGRFSGAARGPDVVVVDLNVPILTGHEVINVIKSNSTLRSLPIVVMSISDRYDDVLKAYDLGACAYIVKSSDLAATEKALLALAEFWAGPVVYPGSMHTAERGSGASSGA